MMSRRKQRRLFGATLGEVTKKDFISIARVLCETGASAATTRELGRYFKSQNSRFDLDRFESATKSCKR